MVDGPNGTTSGVEMIFSFVARGVHKVGRVSGKKKTRNASTTDFSRDGPGGWSEHHLLMIVDGKMS